MTLRDVGRDAGRDQRLPSDAALALPHTAEGAGAPRAAEAGDDDVLKLLAVFQAYSSLASAVILAEGYGAYRYRVGEALPGGKVLVAILPGRVILADDGQRITLHMASMAGAHEQADATAQGDGAGATQRDDGPKMSKEAIALLARLDLHPVSEHSPEGYRVGDGFPSFGAMEVGVKPGDIIVAVNGYPVGEYYSDYLVWLSFKTTQKASVLVRNEAGEEFTFHYPEAVRGAGLSR